MGRASLSRRTLALIIGLPLAIVGVLAAVSITRPAATTAVVPAGTALVGSLRRSISTEHAHQGDPVAVTTRAPLPIDDRVTLPAGAEIRGEVERAKGGGRIAGAPELSLRFTSIVVDGATYRITAAPWRARGRSAGGESAAEIGGGAVAGGIVGAVAGSAAKGAVIGAVLGTGVAVATKGQQIVLAAGQPLRITLEEPVTVKLRPHR